MGGEAALGQLRTIAIRGQDASGSTSRRTSRPERKSRQAGEAKFLVQRDLVSGNARTDWDRMVTRTPKPMPFKYSEIVAGGVGYVSGIDSAGRIQASLNSDPPGHAMSGARTAVAVRELTRQSPRLLLDMKNNLKSVKTVAGQTVNGKTLPAVQYDVRDGNFVVMFDPETGCPRASAPATATPSRATRIRPGARRLAHRGRRQGGPCPHLQLNGRELVGDQVRAGHGQSRARPRTCSRFRRRRRPWPRAPRPGNVPYQWIIRRGYWGNLTDSDAIGWDGTARAEPELVDIAPGVSQSRGTTHNVVVVEMDTYLVVFDAPVGEPLSEWAIRAAKQRYPASRSNT